MKLLKFIMLGLGFILLQACSVSPHVTAVPDAQKITKAPTDKALVIFMRPSSFGGAIQAVVYDDTNYISTISYQTQIAYETEPGKHLFMVVSEAADFMEADLKAGKTYYALVTPRVGWWRARFSLKPINDPATEPEFNEWFNETKRMQPNAQGKKWAQDNQQSVLDKKAEYYLKWMEKAENDRPKLIGSK